MRQANTILIVAVSFLLTGCATARQDHHILKLDKTYEPVISNPYEWTLQQFADGPISGPKISDYALLVLKDGLKQAHADLDHDGIQELLIRQDCAARVWEVLVFKPARRGYRYFGHFTATIIVPIPNEPSVLVYEACGGKYGHIKTYRHDGYRFNGALQKSLWSGDGHEEGNQKLAELFPESKVINWSKTPNNILHGAITNHAEP